MKPQTSCVTRRAWQVPMPRPPPAHSQWVWDAAGELPFLPSLWERLTMLVCGPHFRWHKRLRLWPRSPQNTSLHEGRDFVLFTTASQGLQQCLDSIGSR